MTRETTDNDTAEQVIESFRVLAGDKVLENTVLSVYSDLKIEILILGQNRLTKL